MKNSGANAKRILVVEDEPAISEVCLRVLTKEGLEVDIAANGVVAQGMLMNGRQLYQHINERHPKLANGVIFTTGDVIGGDAQSFLKLADRPFLLKPFTPDELKATVRETLKQMEE
jgi:CheY-like chemotaxis protein